MVRNNILLTFSDYGGNSNIGIYRQKRSRELIPVEEIDFITNQSKIIARNLLIWIKVNNIDSIYNYDTKCGMFNHLALRNNENDEYLVEIYMKEINSIVLNRLKFWNWSAFKVKSVYYQLEEGNTNEFRKEYYYLWGDRYLNYNIADCKISIRAGCFFQTNNVVLQKMYKEIINYLLKDKDYNFLDLYCGVGIMSLLVNDKFKNCKGVEVNPNSIDIANYNKEVNNIKNCDFICNKVENVIDELNLDKLVIFLNPPRRGLYENVIHKLNSIKEKTKQILYLSCCKKTLDRDLNLFNYNYKILNEYNMFPNTNHKEYLVLLN
jgi:23S rRNA (uracil1939-C5)-methyltransferase